MKTNNMKNPYVYISCPISIGQDILNEIVVKATEEIPKGWEVTHWVRNSNYDPRLVLDCKIMVIVLPKLDWNCKYENLPPGVNREILLAKSNNKPILLCYRTVDSNYRFYELSLTSLLEGSKSIGGHAGTSNSLSTNCGKIDSGLLEEQGWFFHSLLDMWLQETKDDYIFWTGSKYVDEYGDVVSNKGSITDDQVKSGLEKWWAERRAGRDDKGSSIDDFKPITIDSKSQNYKDLCDYIQNDIKFSKHLYKQDNLEKNKPLLIK